MRDRIRSLLDAGIARTPARRCAPASGGVGISLKGLVVVVVVMILDIITTYSR
jgi:hypothetical protein